MTHVPARIHRKTGTPRGAHPVSLGNLSYGRGDLRWRGKLPIPARAHPLVRSLFEYANAEKTTMTEIADRSGIPRGTLSGWRYSVTPNIASLEAALNVLGLELCVRKRRGDS